MSTGTPLVALAGLDMMDRTELGAVWRSLFGSPPPHRFSQTMMRSVIGFEIQARERGGLNARLKRQLNTLQKQFGRSEAMGTGSPADMKGGGLTTETPSIPHRVCQPLVQPGTRLIREWNGVSHVVEVTEHGAEWNGKHYGSLSSVARAITGAHWSGPRFFGLTARRKA